MKNKTVTVRARIKKWSFYGGVLIYNDVLGINVTVSPKCKEGRKNLRVIGTKNGRVEITIRRLINKRRIKC